MGTPTPTEHLAELVNARASRDGRVARAVRELTSAVEDASLDEHYDFHFYNALKDLMEISGHPVAAGAVGKLERHPLGHDAAWNAGYEAGRNFGYDEGYSAGWDESPEV